MDTELFRHNVGLSWDIEPASISTATLTLGQLPTPLARERSLRAGRSAWTYGVWSSLKGRAEDELSIGLADGWLRFEHAQLRLEIEAVTVRGTIGAPVPDVPGIRLPAVALQQSGGAARASWRALTVEVGAASGDEAPGRGVDGAGQLNLPSDTSWTNLTLSENYTIDRIQWRRGIGAITDAVWLRPSVAVNPTDRLELTGWATWSEPLVRTEEALTTEVGLTGLWHAWKGLQLRTDAAWLIDQTTLLEGTVAWVY
jgi:hypothetical protein